MSDRDGWMGSVFAYDDGSEAPDWRTDANKVTALAKDGTSVDVYLRPWLIRNADISPMRKELGLFWKLRYQGGSGATTDGKDVNVVKWEGDGVWRLGGYYDLINVAIAALKS